MFIQIFIIFIATLMLIFPKTFSLSSLNGISLFATKIFPLMFPFMFFSKLLYLFNFFEKINKPFSYASKKLFNINNKNVGFVWVCALVCGYPLGAKLISNLLDENKITAKEASSMLSFCSTCSPVFILGAIGLTLNNSKLIILILLTHFIASIINGVVFKIKTKLPRHNSSYHEGKQNNILPSLLNQNKTVKQSAFYPSLSFNQKVASAMEESLSASLSVGGYIIVFYILCDGLKLFAKDNYIANILTGLVEMSRGSIFTASTTMPLFIVGLIICFLISFGGLCVHLQHFHFLAKHKLNYFKFFLQKTTQGILHCMLFIICYLLFF